MEQYKIQVVVPVYNNRDSIGRCLQSLVGQTFSQWQAIVVDDASTDGSDAVIKNFAAEDGRFVYIHNGQNGGAAQARNRALSMLDSEYTAFLDADDTWEENMLEVLYSCAVQHGADVVQCRFIYDLPQGRHILPKGAFKEAVLLRGRGLRRVYVRMMTGINMNHVCMKLIRTSLISRLRFNTKLKTAEDLDFCIQLFQNVNSYYFTNDVLYHYYRSATSLTGGGLSFAQKLSANRQVSRTLVAALPLWGMDNMVFKVLAYSRPYIIIISKLFRIIRERVVRCWEKEIEKDANENA